jgi:hypothetical protein
MLRIGGGHERFRLHRQQIVLSHQPCHSFVVHRQATSPQLRADPAVAVMAFMLEEDLMDLLPYLHIRLYRLLLLQRTIKTRLAHPRQPAHALDR